MIPSKLYPVHHKTFNSSQTCTSNPPPKDKIITSKDEAIQQLIYQNTILKKQLSQLMLKTTQNSPQNNSYLSSPINTVRPSITQFNSYRNSLQNSVDFTNQMIPNMHLVNDNIYELKAQHNDKIAGQRQKRSYRHSVDNLCQQYQNISTPIQNSQYPAHQQCHQSPAAQLIHPSSFNKPISNYQQGQQDLCQTSNNNTHFLSNNQDFMTQEDLYREKMIKLKTRRSSHGKRLSQQKQSANTTTNKTAITNNTFQINQKHLKRQRQNELRPSKHQPIQKINPSIHKNQSKEQLAKAHQVLKSKLNSQINYTQRYEQSPIFKLQVNKTQSTYKIQPNNLKQNQLPLSPANVYQKQVKKFPKYTPKNFSKQKQNKIIPDQSKVYTSQTKEDSTKVQQKKVCLRQLRGRVYLDEQGQGCRTKRALSKKNVKQKVKNCNISTNQSQNTVRSKIKETRTQLAKRINTVQSQVTYTDVNSCKRNLPEHRNEGRNVVHTQKPIFKKKSNQVYLDEDQMDKQVVKEKATQNDTKKAINQLQIVNKVPFQDNSQQLVSIEEIHMINLDRPNKNSSVNCLSHLHKKTVSPPNSISKQNNQISKNKNLYNNVYCQQSIKDLCS